MPFRFRSLLFALVIATPSLALAEPDDSPSVLYERGKSAYDDGDFATAARSFARADELAPHAEVLELAIASANRADDPVLGMALVERASARSLTSIASASRDLFAAKVGRIDIACPGVERCAALVDGAPATVGVAFWSRVGEHEVELDADGEVERFTVHVAATEATSVRPTRVREVPTPVSSPLVFAPPSPIELHDAPVKKEQSSFVHRPAVFLGAAGVTLAALGVTVLSGVDTLDQHARFERERSRTSLAADGESAQTRTNVLIVTTVALALVTTTIGLFVTHWRSS